MINKLDTLKIANDKKIIKELEQGGTSSET